MLSLIQLCLSGNAASQWMPSPNPCPSEKTKWRPLEQLSDFRLRRCIDAFLLLRVYLIQTSLGVTKRDPSAVISLKALLCWHCMPWLFSGPLFRGLWRGTWMALLRYWYQYLIKAMWTLLTFVYHLWVFHHLNYRPHKRALVCPQTTPGLYPCWPWAARDLGDGANHSRTAFVENCATWGAVWVDATRPCCRHFSQLGQLQMEAMLAG